MQIEQILLSLEGGKEKYFIKLNPEEKQTTQVILGQQLSSSSDSGNSERRLWRACGKILSGQAVSGDSAP